jgi:hypothetical protein
MIENHVWQFGTLSQRTASKVHGFKNAPLRCSDVLRRWTAEVIHCQPLCHSDAWVRTKSWGIYNTRHNDWLVDLGYVKDRVGKITIQNPALLENIIFPLKILSNWQLPQDGYQTFRGEALGVYSTSRLYRNSNWLVVSTPWKILVRLDHHPNYWGK